jgi:hypothetical protein
MRGLILLMALGAAAAAAASADAQAYGGLGLSNEALRIAGAEAARNRDIAITNDLSTLQARVQTQQQLSDLAALRANPILPTPILPTPVLPSNGRPSRIDTSKFVSIPDAELAASNARVLAAANNRR